MKDNADKVVFILYGLFGAALGVLIFMFALGGWSFVFTGRATRPWNGAMMLIICAVLGGGWGLVSYRVSDREIGDSNSYFHDPATALLFAKRVLVIATCLAGIYFLWQLTKGM